MATDMETLKRLWRQIAVTVSGIAALFAFLGDEFERARMEDRSKHDAGTHRPTPANRTKSPADTSAGGAIEEE